MTQSVIKDSFYTALSAGVFTGSPDIYFNNTENTNLPNPPLDNHFRAFVLPSDTLGIGVADLDQERGLFQVSVFTKKGENDFDGMELAEEVLSLFPRNTELLESGNVVGRIDNTGSIAPSFFEDGWQITPVSIPYQNLTN